MKTKYSEIDQLTRYVWKHFNQFCTEDEALGYRVAFFEMKAQRSKDKDMAKRLREKARESKDPAILAMLADGYDAFQQRTCERIMRDHGDQIFVNRCPKCNCIVESPIACLCKWCGHKWFERREELRKIVNEKLKQGKSN